MQRRGPDAVHLENTRSFNMTWEVNASSAQKKQVSVVLSFEWINNFYCRFQNNRLYHISSCAHDVVVCEFLPVNKLLYEATCGCGVCTDQSALSFLTKERRGWVCHGFYSHLILISVSLVSLLCLSEICSPGNLVQGAYTPHQYSTEVRILFLFE